MLEEIQRLLLKWKSLKDDRKKLQNTYLTLAVVSILTAGIISLVNAELGQDVALIALGSVSIYLINAIVWHVVVLTLQNKLETTKTPRK